MGLFALVRYALARKERAAHAALAYPLMQTT